MAKKSKKNGSYRKDISEMDDTEFVKNIDYLSSPYYRAYINARVRAELGYNAWSDGVDMREAERARTNDTGKKLGYEKKRVFAVILISLLLLLTLAVCVLDAFDIPSVKKFVSVFEIPETDGAEIKYVTLFDMARGLVDGGFKQDSVYFSAIVSDRLNDASAMQKICIYAAPVAAMLLFVMAAFGFLKSILSLFGGAKNGFYHKYKFGFISILLFLCGAVIILSGVYTVSMNVESIAEFFTGKSNMLNAGVAAYAILIMPLITFISSLASYGRKRAGEKGRKRD